MKTEFMGDPQICNIVPSGLNLSSIIILPNECLDNSYKVAQLFSNCDMVEGILIVKDSDGGINAVTHCWNFDNNKQIYFDATSEECWKGKEYIGKTYTYQECCKYPISKVNKSSDNLSVEWQYSYEMLLNYWKQSWTNPQIQKKVGCKNRLSSWILKILTFMRNLNTSLIILVACTLAACTTKGGKQSIGETAQQSAWQPEYELMAPDSSFSATIDYLPQSDDYEQSIFRLGITPIRSIAEDTVFHTSSIGRTRYYYGSITIQGSMHNTFYAFASADFAGGLFTFTDTDYHLTFPQDYEPHSLADRSIEMQLIK